MVYLAIRYLYGFSDYKGGGAVLEKSREERYLGINVYPTHIGGSNYQDPVIGIDCNRDGEFSRNEYNKLIAFIEEYKAYHNIPNNKTIDLEVYDCIWGDIDNYKEYTYNLNSPFPFPRDDEEESEE